MDKLNKKEELEKFEEFMFYIDDYLDEIKERAAVQGYNLDLSVESLKELANFIRDNKVVNEGEQLDNFFDSWVYLGEVFRRQAKGAKWTVGLDDPRNLNYGQYYLTGYNETGSEFIPILYINNFTLSSEDRLDNNFLYGLIDKSLNPRPVNLDHLPTEE